MNLDTTRRTNLMSNSQTKSEDFNVFYALICIVPKTNLCCSHRVKMHLRNK